MIRPEKLRAAILKSGYRRDFIAENVGLTKSTFKGVCGGFSRISPETAERLAKFLNVPLNEIWSETSKKK